MSYFIAVFGEKYANTSPVDGGKYPLSPADCPSTISAGDTMVLYCTASYPGYYMEAVGLGEVTKVQQNTNEVVIYYKYSPFSQTVSRNKIKACLDGSEMRRFKYLHLSRNWLFEISSPSFNCI
ncbi:MAG: hypothetical protein ABSG90_02365 [Dehalococcoidia bacterium]|jgi:hypothetical protein